MSEKNNRIQPPTCKHATSLPLVNRIGGQVSGIGKMIEDGRYCPDILNQIRAARAALKTLEGRILRGHLQSCVRDAFASTNTDVQAEKIEEVVNLFTRYENEDD
ncbi:MAG: metal-sensitive transcriptional regulator [Alphaproteobacteria bacterium]|nr:metal-sensitive transcriptional regulator [Alphaproteobacteria bacterium]